MALKTLGTTTTTRLPCLPAWAASLLIADVAAIGQAISDDSRIATILYGGGGAGPTAVLATATTNATTALSVLASVSGSPISAIRAGDLVLGDGVIPGTFVTIYGGSTTATLSQATTASAALTKLIFVRPGTNPDISLDGAQLFIPQRGVLKVLPGDIVAVDNTGWPILVSGASIGYSGTDWTLT
jgi:hypothetical protein